MLSIHPRKQRKERVPNLFGKKISLYIDIRLYSVSGNQNGRQKTDNMQFYFCLFVLLLYAFDFSLYYSLLFTSILYSVILCFLSVDPRFPRFPSRFPLFPPVSQSFPSVSPGFPIVSLCFPGFPWFNVLVFTEFKQETL